MKTIAVWFSCGAASAVAAKKTIEKYGKDHIIRVLNNPINEEHPDNKRFLADCEKWLGVKIESVTNKNFKQQSIVDVFNKRKYISGVAGAPCTQELKKKARQQWEAENKFDYIVLGFTFDEIKRHERFILTERDNVLPVLIDLKMTKDDCFKILIDEKIELPLIYSLGYPNANCLGCVKSSSPTYWNLTRKMFPDVFKQRAEQSRLIKCRLVIYKGKRIFLDELPEDAKGRDLKSIKSIDCGIYCEDKK